MAQIPVLAYVVIWAGMIVWLLPFILTGWSKRRPEKRDPRWRWGVALEIAGYLTIGLVHFGPIRIEGWRIALSAAWFALAWVLSWTSTRALGRYLRFEAAIDADHQLIRSGPYRIVRHPIYASMLCVFFAIAAMVATPVLFVVGLALFIAGTEVRVRVEDRLLGARFGEEFEEYRRSTAAYVPLLR